MREYRIPWCKNHPYYEPGTMADIGMIRLELERTNRAKNNKWCLYLCIRTTQRWGVTDDLKRGVCVARFPAKLSLEEAQKCARSYLAEWIWDLASDLDGASE